MRPLPNTRDGRPLYLEYSSPVKYRKVVTTKKVYNKNYVKPYTPPYQSSY